MNRRIAAFLLVLAAFFGGVVAVSARGLPPDPLLHVNSLAVSSNADIATSTITIDRPCAVRVTIALNDTDSVVNVIINGRPYGLNTSTALSAGDLFTFVYALKDGDTLNVQAETGTEIGYLLLDQIKDGAL